ncbi:Molybdate-binding periplasmic protein precursor [Jannaschia rubra]|uniref:Molybdate-binding periplasmic protein n=2 Tax=Jannaschia rubra TaxID=282197 RepID=A0A0M6XTS4_9RHOB|nr:Molybdate-binding periplasmic protein precursor [Jannaschia rubra]SFG00042.1 molybdate transport system substrate-binding protein [Jannaschia rubra]
MMPAAFLRPALFAMLATGSPTAADTVTVFAAASMKNAMDEIATAWQAETGHTLAVSLAGSSELARQIEQDAPADVFISANADWMDRLQDDGLIDADSRFDLLGNALVLVAHGDEAAPVQIAPGFDLMGLLGDGRLAMAMVDAVPAGIYGRAALDRLGIWDEVAPQVAQADNVRAALAFVATGEAPMGIVYATDAVASDDVTVVGTFPADGHPPIVYPAASVAASDSPLKGDVLDFLRGDAARAAFARQGFTVLVD